MRLYRCDDCQSTMRNRDEVNTVTLGNVFHEPLEYHYCCGCATAMFPQTAMAMISWTAPSRTHTQNPPKETAE